jgi:hypothetical protein
MMTDPADAVLEPGQDDVRRRYRAISQEPRYGHYARIPERICRCLDYFRISSNRRAIGQRLHSYYLFIGVVDDVMDSGEAEAGRQILEQLDNRNPLFDDETNESDARLVTEVLKCHISPETYPAVLAKFEELYEAVVKERKSTTMSAYLWQRKAVGRLTAEVSYLLIRPLLVTEHKEVADFLQKVGEVGCLIDSAIDLRVDVRLSLTSFRPTPRDYLQLVIHLLRDGFRILLRHPRLLGLFLEAMTDTVLDCQFRVGRLKRSWSGSGPADPADAGALLLADQGNFKR